MFYNWWFTCLTSTIESETLKRNDLVLLIPSIMSQRRQWHPTLVLLPGKSHGQRSLVGCSHGVAKSWTRLSDFTFTFRFHALEKAMATHSSVLAWRIPGVEEPGGLPSMGSHRVGHDWSDLAAAAALCLAHIYSISGILKRDEERKGRNKGRRKAGREGGKEERRKKGRRGRGKGEGRWKTLWRHREFSQKTDSGIHFF